MTHINCGGSLLNLTNPVVMGILNISPDSFYDGGKYLNDKSYIYQTKKMLEEGASIIDIGGISTRPGANDVPEEIELNRLAPVVINLIKEFPEIIISVDTYRSNVARNLINEGAHIINDISGGNYDENMFNTVAELNVPYILMHIKGNPQNMQMSPYYENVVPEIIKHFSTKIEKLKKLGHKDIIIDPGFGFGKTIEHNYEIMNKLELFRFFDLPILAGISRKSMINRVLGINAAESLNGTSILNTISLLNGVKILRVHDVKEAMEAIKLSTELKKTDSV